MSDNEDGSADLTGFLFGNIDSKGNLENDVLDEEAKSHLSQLNSLTGLGNFVTSLVDNKRDVENTVEEGKILTMPDAIDYSNIDELADDNDISSTSMLATIKPASRQQDEDDDYDDENLPTTSTSSKGSQQQPSSSKSKSGGMTDIILPSIVSHRHHHSELTSPRKASSESDHKQLHSGEKKKKKKHDKLSKHRKKKRKDRELERLRQQQADAEEAAFEKKMKDLESKIQATDIHELFPEFRKDKVLRFLRLFGPGKPSSLPNRWRNCRGKRKKKKVIDRSNLNTDKNEIIEEEWTMQELPMPNPQDIETDDEIRMLRPQKPKQSESERKKQYQDSIKKVEIPAWRYGPAALWYDMMGVSETGEGFDYGFKLKENKDEPSTKTEDVLATIPSEKFNMVMQVRWEDDIIWNADDLRNKIGKVDKTAQAGWVPTSTQRTASSTAKPPLPFPPTETTNTDENKKFNSIFPIDNYELIYGDWEKDIIWDDQNMDTIPEPKVFQLNLNDENITLGLPDEPKEIDEKVTKETKKESLKKSKLLLGKAIKENDEEQELLAISKLDEWNLSNDRFYESKKSSSDKLAVGLQTSLLQHSIPAMELQHPFFPTHMGPIALHNFHRPHLKRISKGPLSAKNNFHVVQCLRKHIRQKAKQREQERAASGGGEVFFMRKLEDLSAQDGIVVLAEFSEEYPPLICNVGMNSKIKNYYKRKPDKDSDPPRCRFGELVLAHTSPFLGSLAPGQCLQALENNMFRSPIYEHKMRMTDFLIIRTKSDYFIRHVPYVFTIGQECPMMEVPGPNSKKSTNHVRDFLQVYIYRLFAKNTDKPKRIKMEEIRKAFPSHSESSIRKRLKLCADFNRTGPDSNWWVIKNDFRLPSEEEMRAMVLPEHCCANASMLAAEQRLKDAGYGDKTMLYTPEDDNGEDHQMKVDEEVLNAPWNTTRAYLSAISGKCLLQVTGPADPTGCGEGFSYVKVPTKPQQQKDESAPAPPKKLVRGTDADLRRLSLSNAKQILKKYGVADEEIKKLSRWEVIDVVRTMSTEQARAGAGGMSKFARGTRFSVAEHQERYKEECQRVFDLQNKVLSSHQILSTDEDSTSGDDSDFEEMGKNIESILSNKKSTSQVSHEREEQERKELMKMISEDNKSSVSNKPATPNIKKEKLDDAPSSPASFAGRCLRIYRKFKHEDGTEFTRVETVRKADVIDAYVRIRTSKDDDFIKKFIMMDEQNREEMRREKRRIQEQLRRIKRNQEKDRLNYEKRKEKDKKVKDKQEILKTNSQMKCGACGQMGHMRTNRFCPMYNRSYAPPDRPVALTQEEEESMEREMLGDTSNLIKVEGTKITLSKDLIKSAEAVRRKSLVLKFQKPETPSQSKRKRKYQGSITHCDYLTRPAKKKERRRADPVITMSSLLEQILNSIRDLPETHPFHIPVNPRVVKDYYKIIEKPMDLQTIRENIRKRMYLSRADFREHIELITTNSRIYNGAESLLSKTAHAMLEFCDKQFKDYEDKLMRLEKAINPLLDDDDQVAFSFVLDNIISSKMMAVPDSWPFHNPVNKKFVPDYYQVIERPMDLGTIKKNVQKHLYQNRGQFVEHVELILANSVRFNGGESKFTETARKIVAICQETLDEYDAHLTQLENDIAAAKKAAEEEAADIADDDVMDQSTMGFGTDEESNMSTQATSNYQQGTATADESDVDIESIEDMNTGDAQPISAEDTLPTEERPTLQQSKSFLLEDLLMSDGEMSGSEGGGDGNSEDEDNPFASKEFDSDRSDDERGVASGGNMQRNPDDSLEGNRNFPKQDDNSSKFEFQPSPTSNAMQGPPVDEETKPSQAATATFNLSSEGEDSDPGSKSGSFVSIGGEVISDSDLSNQ